MHIGVCLPNYGRASSPEAICEVAQAAEALGFDSIWTTDHILVPEAYEEPYGRIFETWTTLAYVAALTRRVRLGTSILILGLRNPVLVAKQAATLDQLSNGRLILGIGAGWLASEFENLGMSFRRRIRFLEEGILLMRTLWTTPRPRFEGRFFRIRDAVFEPPPVQSGGPPIWIGGNTEAAVQRAARLGDGWHPVGLDPETLRARVAQLREQSAGRSLRVVCRMYVALGSSLPLVYTSPTGEPRMRLTGSLEQIAEGLRQLQEAGADGVVFTFEAPSVAAQIEQMQRLAALRPWFVSSPA
ncbi:MAG: LLM class F420-dependent oxidoreductase [Anaerolineae bacterium]|nr:LLM class F420-dependent oxidoreductase [Thermoflexus sp.]MDW8064690.1 LLM class F420-dependent oxidoreductase [Anaerolineae bacterium]